MPIFFDEIVVMEDDKRTRNSISNALRGFGFRVTVAKNAEDVLRTAKRRNARRYILDINMGHGREHEGLDALEKLKGINENIFVGILSGYAHSYQQMADRLSVDYFHAKTANTERDVYNIVAKMLLHDEVLFQQRLREIRNSLDEKIVFINEVQLDENISAYKKLRSDSNWVSNNKGYYVGFVEGINMGKNKDQGKLLRELREKFSGKRIFLVKVEDNENVIDLPSPLEILD